MKMQCHCLTALPALAAHHAPVKGLGVRSRFCDALCSAVGDPNSQRTSGGIKQQKLYSAAGDVCVCVCVCVCVTISACTTGQWDEMMHEVQLSGKGLRCE